jgi:DNA polymerase I
MKVATQEAYQLFHEGSLALANVEANGMRVDIDYLDKAIRKIDEDIADLNRQLQGDKVYQQWRKRFGNRTNLGSRSQLAEVVFGELGYESKERTKGGKRAKASESVLESVDLPFVKDYVRLEKLKKVRGTHLEGIRSEVTDSYVHPSFNLNLIVSFRSSCSNPNIQNVPIRDPEFSEVVRRCFIAPKNHHLVEIDFTAIEVRITACYNHDPVLIEYINDPSKDMHRDLAMQIYKLKKGQVSKEIRHCAKNQFVFPEFYGDWYIDCAKMLWESIDRRSLTTPAGESVKEHLIAKGIKSLGECNPQALPRPHTFEEHVKEIEFDFQKRRFKKHWEWKEEWWNQYLRRGWFQMETGFIGSGIYNKKEVCNYPVQGSAFHCLLWSLVQISKEIQRRKMRSKIVGEIHDSILAYVHKTELHDFLKLARRVMTVDLVRHWPWITVPILVEAEVAPCEASWFDKQPMEIL